jgi:hypothetical protein
VPRLPVSRRSSRIRRHQQERAKAVFVAYVSSRSAAQARSLLGDALLLLREGWGESPKDKARVAAAGWCVRLALGLLGGLPPSLLEPVVQSLAQALRQGEGPLSPDAIAEAQAKQS